MTDSPLQPALDVATDVLDSLGLRYALKAFSDRPRDHEDLMKLIAVGGRKLDMPYIENWARELDRSMGCDEVTERLERARHEAARRTSASTRRRGGDH